MRELKDSINGWLKEIPKDWEVKKLKYLCKIDTGSKDTQDKIDGGAYPFFVRSPIIESLNEYTHHEEAVLTAGDGVGVGKVFHYFEGKFAAHQRVYVFTKFKKVEGKFVYYYLLSNLANEVSMGGAKSTVDSIRRNMLSEFPVSIPKIDEQKQIIKFLEIKVIEINILIGKGESLISLLEQQRQSIITEAVTKGLNPNVKMKDSGVEWIGEIPEHWNITKIKYTTYVKGRIGWQGLKTDEFVDEGPYLVTGTDFINGYVNWETCYHIGEERYDEAPPIQLKENDLLITKDGTIGKLAIVKDLPYKAILNSGIFVTRPLNGQYLSKYMYWLLSSNIFEKYITLMETGSTIKHLYQETFVNFSYPLPLIEEQFELVGFLDEKVRSVDEIKNNLEIQIQKLKQYRQSLIYEAVTGKIDVRDLNLDEVR